MKTATFPAVRVTPDLRQAAERVLEDGETLSSFVEQSIREHIERRLVQQEFIARGLRSGDNARRTGNYIDAADVVTKLEQMLEAAKAGR